MAGRTPPTRPGLDRSSTGRDSFPRGRWGFTWVIESEGVTSCEVDG